jgi:hypothetical protein
MSISTRGFVDDAASDAAPGADLANEATC